MILGIATTMAFGARCNAQCNAFEVETFNGFFCQFAGFTGMTPQAINDNGTIVGYYNNCNFDQRAFRWSSGPSITALPLTPGLSSQPAYDVNSYDQIVGEMVLSSGPVTGKRGYVLQQGSYTDFGTLLNSTEVVALAVNDLGQSCGYANNGIVGPLRAFIRSSGQMSALELPIGRYAVAYDINNHSQVVGWMGVSFGGNFAAEAFLWQNGVGVSIGIPPGSLSSEARYITNNGQIAGHHMVQVSPGVKRRRAFHWRNGVFTDLGFFPSLDTVTVRGINERGEIVGYCSDTNGGHSVPFIWRDGVMTDLNELADLPPITVIDDAYGINNQGQIAASGRILELDDINVGFRLTPRSKVLGDLDCNHIVDVEDLLSVIRVWGPALGNSPADFNDDQLVNVQDLLTVIVNWTD